MAAWAGSRDNLELKRQRLATRGLSRWVILALGVVAIIQWQSAFFRHGFPGDTLQSSYSLEASSGVLGPQESFVYFLYYLNLFPVVSVTERGHPLEFSREGAQRVFETQGHTLAMERLWTIRYGDLLKSYLYLPQAYVRGTPEEPSMVLANGVAWTAALVALFVAFWAADHPLLGLILVVILGSNPFQVGEVYARNNVFGWVITAGVLMLALHVPILGSRPPSRAYLAVAPVAAGLFLGTIRHVRTEPVMVGLSVVLAYLTARSLRPRTRLAMIGALAIAFWASSAAWTSYFDLKFREAHARVQSAGGNPYDGPRHAYHFVWHALWCGLGDFDTRHGYVWNDLQGMEYALPIMKQRGFVATGYPALEPGRYDAFTLGVYWDSARMYARTPFELPEYTAVLREKVVHDVTHDPLWYLAILARRAWRILTDTTPPSLTMGHGGRWSLPRSPFWGFLPAAVAALLARARSTFLLKVLLFTLPLVATPLLVYSGRGTVYYGIAHLVAFGCCVAWAVEAVFDWLVPRVVFGVVWRGRLHLLPREPQALRHPRAHDIEGRAKEACSRP